MFVWVCHRPANCQMVESWPLFFFPLVSGSEYKDSWGKCGSGKATEERQNHGISINILQVYRLLWLGRMAGKKIKNFGSKKTKKGRGEGKNYIKRGKMHSNCIILLWMLKKIVGRGIIEMHNIHTPDKLFSKILFKFW